MKNQNIAECEQPTQAKDVARWRMHGKRSASNDACEWIQSQDIKERDSQITDLLITVLELQLKLKNKKSKIV